MASGVKDDDARFQRNDLILTGKMAKMGAEAMKILASA